MLLRILVLVLGVTIGFWVVRYRVKVVDTVGKMEWAERSLGNGATYNVWVLIGTGIVAGSILYFFGLFPGA